MDGCQVLIGCRRAKRRRNGVRDNQVRPSFSAFFQQQRKSRRGSPIEANGYCTGGRCLQDALRECWTVNPLSILRSQPSERPHQRHSIRGDETCRLHCPAHRFVAMGFNNSMNASGAQPEWLMLPSGSHHACGSVRVCRHIHTHSDDSPAASVEVMHHRGRKISGDSG